MACTPRIGTTAPRNVIIVPTAGGRPCRWWRLRRPGRGLAATGAAGMRGGCQDGGMTGTRSAVDLLRADIERAGYYPQIVTDGIRAMLGDEPVLEHLVHHEATFDNELRRHLTVLVLTPSRLIFGHTDEHAAEPGGSPAATTTAEAVGVRRQSLRPGGRAHDRLGGDQPDRPRAGRMR